MGYFGGVAAKRDGAKRVTIPNKLREDLCMSEETLSSYSAEDDGLSRQSSSKGPNLKWSPCSFFSPGTLIDQSPKPQKGLAPELHIAHKVH